MDDALPPKSGPDARQRRDDALRRVDHTRRWVIGSSAALTAGFAVLVAQVAHGRSNHPTPRSTAAVARPASQSEPALPALASADSLGLQGPAQVPQAAPQPAPQPAPSAPQSTPAPSAPSDAGSAPPVSGGS